MTDTKTLTQIQHQAVLLAGLLETIDFLENEGRCQEGRASITMVALERSQALANDLDRLNASKA